MNILKTITEKLSYKLTYKQKRELIKLRQREYASVAMHTAIPKENFLAARRETVFDYAPSPYTPQLVGILDDLIPLDALLVGNIADKDDGTSTPTYEPSVKQEINNVVDDSTNISSDKYSDFSPSSDDSSIRDSSYSDYSGGSDYSDFSSSDSGSSSFGD